jgi:DNA repair ATPase RecN
MEAAWAAVAVTSSIAGGLYTTVYHSGASATQILELQQKQADTYTRLSKHDDQLSAIQQQNATIAQKLDDAAKQLDRIEKKL